ncbi:MAG: hypothetical protein NE328_17690 [Lentisphaeraceae bacterium]|nr:hypothetical protein [Lentisphaeraceae bacterium]
MLLLEYFVLYIPYILLIYMASLLQKSSKSKWFILARFSGLLTFVCELIRFTIPYFFLSFFKEGDSVINVNFNIIWLRDIIFLIGLFLLALGLRSQYRVAKK